LAEEGVAVRVVSMPNPGKFLQQDAAYREAVLPARLQARVAVEAGVSHYWHAFVGPSGKIIGIDTFGASAPANILFEQYGFTVPHVCEAVRAVIGASEA
jgi:transketolase